LLRAAEAFFKGPVELKGSGRTDAGVHAYAQVAHLRANPRRPVDCGELLAALNDDLPQDIAVLKVESASERFDARHDALSRTYVYRIATRKTAFAKRYVWWVKQPLDVALMRAAAAMFAGRHDFRCFCDYDAAKPRQSTLVQVESAAIVEQEGLILFRIRASHFLWRMVRRLAGVLVRAGRGELDLEAVRALLAAQPRPEWDVAAWTAPASGLFLERVDYPDTPPSACVRPVRPRYLGQK
jgi:tRNA pseudouridine38-40 synthase